MSFFGLPFLSKESPLVEKNEDKVVLTTEENPAVVTKPPEEEEEETKDDKEGTKDEQDENRAPPVDEQCFDSVEVDDLKVQIPAVQDPLQQQPYTPSTLQASLSSPTRVLECDYDVDPTQLYEYLQLRNWEQATERCKQYEREARTWVSRKESDGKLRWRLLPLHAAIIFKAPEVVIEALLAAYPKGAECKDDQGMLPLHLAFRNGSSEGIVNILLAAYPQSINVKDRKGRIPLVLAQASTSPNRDAFMRALERGPTYYAVAAAATERAAVTAEQQALFDAKILEVNESHRQETEMLRVDHEQRTMDMQERIQELEGDLVKTQETSQVLVDHVNTLEAQLKSRTDTERFLATRIAALDSDLRETSKGKEDLEATLRLTNESLQVEKQGLQERLQSLEEEHAFQGEKLAQAEESLASLQGGYERETKERDERISSLEMEWAAAKASEAILEAQLKKRIKSEQSLANEVSFLASRLAESAADSSQSVGTYGARVRSIEKERDELRSTVKILTLKLQNVASQLDDMMIGQQKIVEAAAIHDQNMAEAADIQEKLIEHTKRHHYLYEQAQKEREEITQAIQRQEKEAAKHADERKSIIEAFELQAEQMEFSKTERKQLVDKVEQQRLEIKHLIVSDLSGIQSALSEGEDMVDAVVKHVMTADPVEDTWHSADGLSPEDADLDDVVPAGLEEVHSAQGAVSSSVGEVVSTTARLVEERKAQEEAMSSP